MPTQTPWETVVANALIGTDRQPPQLPTGEGPLPELLSQVQSDPDATLLQSAGILASYQQAGQCPLSHVGQLPSPCPAESLSQCSDRTHQHLQTILSGEYREVLPELLRLIAQADQHVPAEMLPTLLNQGRGQTDLRPSIQAVMGERGRWLAQHNSAWAYAAGQALPQTETGEVDQEAVENLWKTSDQPLRVDLLKTFRSFNPDAAREMLATTWKQEKAKDRATFLAALQAHLSLADESFLESALGDRTQDVRACAGDLLAHLPESQYCQRMSERVKTYVQFEGGTVNIQLPTDDGSWKNEGLQAQSGQLGKRASLLQQILAAVPLKIWLDNPQPLIQAAHTHQHGAVLVQGWTLAAKRQANATWAEALIDYWLRQPDVEGCGQLFFLFELLQTQQIESLIQEWLAGLSSQSEKTSQCLVFASLSPMLSPPFSQFLWDILKPEMGQLLAKLKNPSQVRSLVETVILHLHPIVADDVVAYLNTMDLTSLPTYQQDKWGEWQNLLQFRQAMWAEF